MDVSVIADTLTIATQQGLGFTNSIIHRQNCVSNGSLALSAGFLQISAVILDAIAPPPVKSNSHITARRTLLRKKRRTRRRSSSGGGYEEFGEDSGFWGGDGDGDGPFGGAGGSWGGGRGWNFDRFGGQNWDESSWSSSSEFAYGFVYEVIYWIALSTCVHFAFEKVVRIMADGIGDAEREKVPMRLTSVC
ncbi:hypothetical protein P3X46_005922 [Hevea brasiliensis]|uniref:Uncharacterized protein n=1 Tax=Hevea brasiliensis TaxID=3981 RepID=A0ABQ9MQG3_HEVBR|nr:uncharacterized protein LOC110633121 [Hevea brasiliensis]KAJ9181875.1 hypothetical protein P3X46_005922 [Hevea brasiliensis]